MKLSICCITYNHANYIRQAIEGFQKQKTNFSFEIIISDDHSEDGTREIIQEYAGRDRRIKFLSNDKNIGMMPNFIKALENCSGEYIALCEGDDYWIDENKLQMQVDFLEQHKDFAICFHRAQLVYEANVPQDYRDINKCTAGVTRLQDLIQGNYIHTPTCVYRKNFSAFPFWFCRVPTGDWVLHILNAEYGKIKFIDKEMAAYRIHFNGVLSTKKAGGPQDVKKMEMYKLLADYFRGRNSEACKWFANLHYHQKAFYHGIVNVQQRSNISRFFLLVHCTLKTKKPKLLAAAFLSLLLSGEQLRKVWEAATQKKRQFAV